MGRWMFALATAIAIALNPNIAKAEMTVKQLLKDYDDGTADNRRFIEMLISQTENGFSWANTYLDTSRHEARLYCVPDKFVLTGNQIIETLRREIEDSPKLAEAPFGYGILVVNMRVFPCKNSN
ncbi:hypothetical protein [Bradyrhizobium sp. Ash2021]|uniref:hypothetical protein n=1 Tax=Bradyrhizobium sp. Ash2021 TaxID=2954771 RepID=UPI0028159A4A|nr:hypothetical protein [Bradyrhizobium sp. Ash2021]WMT71916.1 hypothetical protein NL528_28060 [Bradyrhizobium sp. Ash2021]